MSAVLCDDSDEDKQSRLFLPLLSIVILIYLCFGGLLFSRIEGPQEVEDLMTLERNLNALADKNNMTVENLRKILEEYSKIIDIGYTISDLYNEHANSRKWGFLGSFIFSGTVVTTMGFGIATPNSNAGRLVFIIYGLIGVPAMFLFFNTSLVRFIEYFTSLVNWIKRRRRQKITRERKRRKPYIASPIHVLLALFSLTCIVLCVMSAVYIHTESDWDFLTSLYYCFTAASTIGFGDVVSGRKQVYGTINRYIYHVIDGVMVTVACCCVYALFNMESLFVKKFVDYVVIQLKRCARCLASRNTKSDEDANGNVFGYHENESDSFKVNKDSVSAEHHQSGYSITNLDEESRSKSEEIAEENIATTRRKSHGSKLKLPPYSRKSWPAKGSDRSGDGRESARNYNKKYTVKFDDPRSSSRTRTLSRNDSFGRPRLERRNSDTVLFLPTFTQMAPSRLAQSVRTDVFHQESSHRENTGWEESSDVFPLSILHKKMNW